MSVVASSRYGLIPDAFHAIEGSNDYMLITKKYTEYIALILNGHRGSTAKLWMLYIELVHIFLRFS